MELDQLHIVKRRAVLFNLFLTGEASATARTNFFSIAFVNDLDSFGISLL